MQKNVTPGRRKGCPNYPPEFKQLLVAASCEPGISISKLALENGINANLLFKWRQQWREGKLLLPSHTCIPGEKRQNPAHRKGGGGFTEIIYV
ncbi:transposase [Escherichia coli]|uniref:transposase n=1 Tax=Escherichia coli TaxID=562 RepID=UPI0037567D34